MCVGVCVCRQKTRLFAVLLLENRHEIALYRSASQFIFFERCLESRTSLLWPWVSNSCTAPRGIEHYGNCMGVSAHDEPERALEMQIGKRQELGELGYGTESRSIPAQSKPTINLLSFTMTVLHAEPFNRFTYSHGPPPCL